jgi:uncharacterized membrane protein
MDVIKTQNLELKTLIMQHSPYPRMAIALMALIGLFDAAYLALERVTGGTLVCPVGGGCEAVQSSAYSILFGVPVAYIGVAGYAALLAAALLALNVDQVVGLSLATVLLVLASIALVAGIYFSYLQVAVIGAICFWCVISALLDVGIWVAALLNWRMARSER